MDVLDLLDLLGLDYGKAPVRVMRAEAFTGWIREPGPGSPADPLRRC